MKIRNSTAAPAAQSAGNRGAFAHAQQAEAPGLKPVSTADEHWLGRLRDLEAYVLEHGQLPVSTSTDRRVMRLYSWFQKQRSMTNRGLLQESRVEHFRTSLAEIESARHIADNRPQTARWKDSLVSLDTFVKEHGRMPKSTGPEPADISLQRWFMNQRRAVKAGNLPQELVQLWEDSPAVRDSARLVRENLSDSSAWRARLADYERFVAEHDRQPLSDSPDTREFSLYHWGNTQRKARKQGKLIKERVKEIRRRCPEIFKQRQQDHTWSIPEDQKQEAVLEFRRQNGRAPDPQSDNEQEARLGAWESRSRQLAPNDASHAAWMDERTEVLVEAKWDAKARTLSRILRSTGRMPNGTKGNEHKALTLWIRQQREALQEGELSPGRTGTLNAMSLRILAPSKPTFEGRAQEVRAFIDTHGRLPRQRRAEFEGEKTLYGWIRWQAQYAKEGSLAPERRAHIQEVVPEVFNFYTQE